MLLNRTKTECDKCNEGGGGGNWERKIIKNHN